MHSSRLVPATLSTTLLASACLLGFGRLSAVETPAGIPTIWVLGDSTAHNTGQGRNGQPVEGWGTPLADYFDPIKAVVENVGHAGTSSRTYYNNPQDWPRVLPLIKSGDYLLLVFGINDGGPPTSVRSRGSIPGIGDETVNLPRPDGTVEVAHTYGWYMTAMTTDARAKGAHVCLLTVTTRNMWTNPKVKFRDATPIGPLPPDYDPKEDRIERGTADGKYTEWTKELGPKLHVPVLDLTNLCADKYEKMGREAANAFYSDHNHTYKPGADLVAGTIVSGLKAFPHSPFLALLSAKGEAVPTADAKYVSANSPPAP
jgi:lysophospholipase L1-like esterase